MVIAVAQTAPADIMPTTAGQVACLSGGIVRL
jgi:hypothetical protein